MPDLQDLPACQRGRDLPRAASKGARACLRKRSHEDQLCPTMASINGNGRAHDPALWTTASANPIPWLGGREGIVVRCKTAVRLADSERYTYNSGPIPAR